MKADRVGGVCAKPATQRQTWIWVSARLPLIQLPAALLAGALATGCVSQAPAPVPMATAASAASAEVWYQQARAAGREVLTIDAAQSLIVVTVRRGGALARLGHDHVVASRSVTGLVAPQDGRADFQFRLDKMTVDETALRREAALQTEPDAEAIAATRVNMLTKVLDAERYPLVLLHAQRPAAGAKTSSSTSGAALTQEQQQLRLSITFHGVQREVTLPVTIERSAGGLVASGVLQLRQSEFGITPMSIMGGAMRVEDAMELRFRLVAR
jgi:polyisoprenoid-binding protein YceI